MRLTVRLPILPILLILLLGAGCGGGAASEDPDAPAPVSLRNRPNLIAFEELRQHGRFSNLYDLIASLRPRWLRPQGPDTFMGKSGQVQVHMDGNRLGDVEVLRRIAVSGVTSIEWIGPIDAGARFGLDHSHGAIVISTQPIH